MEVIVTKLLDTGSGDGYGYGSGDGAGYGDSYGYGYGNGNGSGKLKYDIAGLLTDDLYFSRSLLGINTPSLR